MDTSNNNHLNMLMLPDEILLTIFNELNMIDVLYSLVDVNERFDHLILNSFYIRNLNMGDSILRDLLTQQITNLTIDIENTPPLEECTIPSDIFALVLSLCKRLTNLNFCQLYHDRSLSICICYDATLTRYMSSTLATLKISVLGFVFISNPLSTI
ncbi:unnamed protein product [Rotaria sordida]|uniref:F-box domain-containing protein n=1 Tax=Rotaria sordida TaxID=392033 RepID=A0A818KDW2_9BILA|nr:unnamed protein product [Rotaria sordida]